MGVRKIQELHRIENHMHIVYTMTHQNKTFYEKEVERIIKESNIPHHHYAHTRKSKGFMEKYFAEKINLEAIAESAFMSRFHFIRVFQQIYGMTPRQYLKDMRIAKARELLLAGRPIAEVCFDVGYESLPTFSRIFKSGTGLSPKKFQEAALLNP